MRRRIRFLPLLLLLLLCSCAPKERQGGTWDELELDHRVELQYAEQFSIDCYQGGCQKITIGTDGTYLVVPEGGEVPADIPEGVTVLQQPLDSIYLVATSAMDLVRELDSIGAVTLSGTDVNGWYIEEARQAMEEGRMAYAGKYSAPDYELILDQGCNLAIESTMIYHSPEVKEQLERFGIPVLVERSSYESHPLGRMEWIKLYGALLGKEQEAQDYFDGLLERLAPILEQENTGKTAAFFFITASGGVNVRRSGDYVAKAIGLAGGVYAFPDLTGESGVQSTVNIQMEEFYQKARDADILIYNSTIDGELETLDQLLVSLRFVQDVAKGERPFFRHPIFVAGLFTAALIAVMYWFFGTELGAALRATGSNPNMARAQGINTDFTKVLGLMLSNGIVALSGALLAQYNSASEINMGRGAIVIGLAAVIIGQVLFGRIFRNFALKLLAVSFGAIIYYIVIQAVLSMGLNPNYLKLLSAAVVAVFLSVPYWKGRYVPGKVRTGGAGHA